MPKLFIRDVGSHPWRDLEVTLFKDGELQFESNGGKYVHINIDRAGVEELLEFLLKEIRPTLRGSDVALPPLETTADPAVVIKTGYRANSPRRTR